MLKQLKAFVQSIEKAEDGTLSVAIATDGSIDRDGERIDPKGWDFSDFLRNPVLLWAHNYREEPLGKVLSINEEGGKVFFRPQFAVGISERAKRMFDFYKEGVMNAFSVGFIPMEWKDEKNADGSTTRVYTRTKLLEISAVPVPSNPNALVLARSKGMDAEMIADLEKGMKDALAAAPAATEPEKPAPAAEPEKPVAEPEKPAAEDPEAEKTAKLKADIMESVSGMIKEAQDGHRKELQDEVHKIMQAIAGINGKDGAGGGEPGKKVEGESEVTVDDMVKRVLQHLDKGIGTALRDIKAREKRD